MTPAAKEITEQLTAAMRTVALAQLRAKTASPLAMSIPAIQELGGIVNKLKELTITIGKLEL